MIKDYWKTGVTRIIGNQGVIRIIGIRGNKDYWNQRGNKDYWVPLGVLKFCWGTGRQGLLRLFSRGEFMMGYCGGNSRGI